MQDASDFLADAGDEADTPDAVNKRNAIVEDEDDIGLYLGPGEEIPPDPDLADTDTDASEVSVSYNEIDAASSSDSIIDGLSSHASEPPPVEPSASDPISIEENVLQTVLGDQDLSATDQAIINEDRGVTTSINAEEAADEAVSSPFRARANSLGDTPVRTAMNGNFPKVADVFGVGTHATDLTASLDIDDFVTYLRIYRSMSPEWDD